MTRAATALADPPTTRSTTDEYFARLALEQLIESPLNPRKTFSDAKLQELADSITSKGVIEPLVVRSLGFDNDGAAAIGDEAFEIICGARRFRAAKLAGLSHLPTVVRHYTDAQALEIMAIENGQRDDVAPLEEAAGYKQLLLIDQTYTAAMIASRIGHTERYVFDRIRLLDLVPALQAHLTAGRIGVEHAEILAKLKPAEQKTAAEPARGALFEADYAVKFGEDPTAPKFKARSVRQLREWIARHIRFDVQHAAATAPLEFGETATRVAEAEAQPGRGKKVVPITFEHMCPDGAKAEERTYGSTAWKLAENKDRQATCDHAVLGLVVAGEHYGESFHVCIARDRCTTHWKAEVAAKQKAEKLRTAGKGKQAAKVEKKAEKKTEDKWEREQRERETREKAWTAIKPHIVAEAVAQVLVVSNLTAAHAAALEKTDGGLSFNGVKTHLGAAWWKTPATALLVSAVVDFTFSAYGNKQSGFDQYVAEVAKPFGLNLKRLTTVRDAHASEAAALKSERDLQGGKMVQEMRAGAAKKASTLKKAAKKR